MGLGKLFLLLMLLTLLDSPSAAQGRVTAEVLPEEVTGAEFRPLDGGAAIRLAAHKGKVIVLILWASWCAPCRMPVKGLAQFSTEFASRGGVVIGLTAEDPATEAEAVRRFVGEPKPELRLGWATKEAAAAIMGGSQSVPQILVISGDGSVMKKFIGWSDKLPGMLREATERALADLPAGRK